MCKNARLALRKSSERSNHASYFIDAVFTKRKTDFNFTELSERS